MKYYTQKFTFSRRINFVDIFHDIPKVLCDIRLNDDYNITRKSFFSLPNGHQIQIKNMHRLCAYKSLNCAICGDTPNIIIESFDTTSNTHIIRFALQIESKRGKTKWHKFFECDHILPSSKGGQTTIANLQMLCAECNGKKADSVSGEIIQKYRRGDIKEQLWKNYQDNPNLKRFDEYYINHFIENNIAENHLFDSHMTLSETMEYIKMVKTEYDMDVEIDELATYSFLEKK